MSAYQEVAKRLFDLTQSDRDWFLARLAVEDRKRVVSALQELASSLPYASRTIDLAATDEAQASNVPATPNDTIRNWSVAKLAGLLAGEPDWIVALVLSGLDGNHSSAVLTHLDATRAGEVRNLLARETGRNRPRLVQTVSKILLEKHDRQLGRQPVQPTFAAALEKFEREQRQDRVVV